MEGKYSCNICCLQMKSQSQLAVHRFRHNPDNLQKHSCDLCGRKFRDVTMLRRHTKTMRHEIIPAALGSCRKKSKPHRTSLF
jgi:hypothetical protein